MKPRQVFRLQFQLLDQVHDRRRKCDEQSRITQDHQRRVDVYPIAAQNRWNRWVRVIEKVGDKSHDENEREREDAERSNAIFRVSDEKSQRGQCAEERESFVLLRQGQVAHFHRAENDRRHVKDKAGEHGRQRGPEEGLFLVQSRENRVHETHEIQTQRESQQDDVHGGDYSTCLAACPCARFVWFLRRFLGRNTNSPPRSLRKNFFGGRLWSFGLRFSRRVLPSKDK